MRVFVVSTGRCGSTTFSNACNHIEGFTSAHETNNYTTNVLYEYPDNHIESDPRLFWKLPQVITKYPEALYVHLIREREECIDSISTRRSLEWLGKFTDVHKILTLGQIAERYYDFTNEMLKSYLSTSGVPTITVSCPPTEEEWTTFLNLLGKMAHFDATITEWGVKYNS